METIPTHELEDIAAARLVRNDIVPSSSPSENLLLAIATGLLLNEIVTIQDERKHIEQSIMNMNQISQIEVAA